MKKILAWIKSDVREYFSLFRVAFFPIAPHDSFWYILGVCLVRAIALILLMSFMLGVFALIFFLKWWFTFGITAV